MNVRMTKLSNITIVSLLVLIMTAGICNAQEEWSRKGKSEFFGTIMWFGSENADFSPQNSLPVRLDFDSTTVYGVGYGYNFTDHWNMNTDLLFGTADTDIIIADIYKVGTEDMDYVIWNVNLDYNILKGRLTPVVTGGLGFVNFSIKTNTEAVGEIHESNFSGNLGAGVRWDIRDNILLKAIYKSTWTTINHSDNDQRFDGVSFSVAYMF